MKSILVSVCLLAIVATVFLSCGTKEEPAKTAVLTGRVTATDTTVYLSGVKVFEKSHGKLSTVTDDNGYFELKGVSFEEHDIYFEKDGYEPDSIMFEYTGELERPIVTRHVIMTPIGDAETTDEPASDSE
jgi:hypothetical protein